MHTKSPKKTSAQNREKLTSSLSAKCSHWLPSPLSVRTHHKFRIIRSFFVCFFTKKCGRPHLKTSPCPQNVHTGQTPWLRPSFKDNLLLYLFNTLPGIKSKSEWCPSLQRWGVVGNVWEIWSTRDLNPYGPPYLPLQKQTSYRL